jgi:hypothetical protein
MIPHQSGAGWKQPLLLIQVAGDRGKGSEPSPNDPGGKGDSWYLFPIGGGLPTQCQQGALG